MLFKCLNGWGGGIKPGEMPVGAAIREFEEETRRDPNQPGSGIILRPEELKLMAILEARRYDKKGDIKTTLIYVYIVLRPSWDIPSTKEMANPQRYPIASLPFAEMMLADKFWVPYIAFGKKVKVKFLYSNDFKKLHGQPDIKEVMSFPEEKTGSH